MWLARSSQVQPIEQRCHSPAVRSATARRSDLPLGQLVSDLLDRQVAKLDQDQPQRVCVPVCLVLVKPVKDASLVRGHLPAVWAYSCSRSHGIKS